ncbi:Hypothetical protein domain [Nesidiocoris tenuis]|uniref:K Homology domain-containing protein n=1 Tax=Nesidiocoris tenuis TaxID=355587 RepID=A0ABN7A960_9HEMI|nr:Hypothetical protein domain [Nesidiocoris tenuis]
MATSAPKLMRSLSTRSVKKVEKPKPVKSSTLQSIASYSLDDVVAMIENASQCIAKRKYAELCTLAAALTPKMRIYGQRIEDTYKDQLDKAFVNFRNGCRDDDLDFLTKINLLHLVELRAMAWHSSSSMNQYYHYKGSSVEDPSDGSISPQLGGNQPLILGPGEVIKSSGKFSSPTKMPGKSYCKDEVVIRNADSGKVMGIRGRRVHMIEELSETVISFQRVNPGAKERLVQITGPDSDKIDFARQLIEDTIKRNASPVRGLEKDATGSTSSLNSSASEDSSRFVGPSSQEWKYMHTVHHEGKSLMMGSSDLEFLQTAKLVLENYLSSDSASAGSDSVFRSQVLNNPEMQSVPVKLSAAVENVKVEQPTQKATSPPVVKLSERDTPKEPARVAASPSKDDTTTKEPPVNTVNPEATKNNAAKEKEQRYFYGRQFLLDCSSTAISFSKPMDYERISKEYPHLIRSVSLNFDAVDYCHKWEASQVVACSVGADHDSD